MLCDKCKKNVATFHSKTIINGMCKEEHLCQLCANREVPVNFGQFQREIFSNPFEMLFSDSIFPSVGIKLREIPSFRSSNNYYANYQNLLKEAVKSVNIGAGNVKENSSELRLSKLENDLRNAIDIEDYEKASIIKKEIDKLKEGN